MNHWVAMMYSTGVSHRSCTRIDCSTASFEISVPAAERSSLIRRRASTTDRPAYFPAACVNLPSRPIASTSKRSCVCHQATSVVSPNVQHMTAPVPFWGSAALSSRIGTRCPKSGTVASRPRSSRKRPSPGCTKIAVQAASNSGRVVAMAKGVPSSNWNSIVTYSLGRSRSASSAWAMAVSHSGHQIVGDFLR